MASNRDESEVWIYEDDWTSNLWSDRFRAGIRERDSGECRASEFGHGMGIRGELHCGNMDGDRSILFDLQWALH